MGNFFFLHLKYKFSNQVNRRGGQINKNKRIKFHSRVVNDNLTDLFPTMEVDRQQKETLFKG